MNPEMSSTTRTHTGQLFERKAEELLIKNRLILVSRNYHCRYGEIDLIMTDADTLVFVEVRYRKNEDFGSASASVTPAKQKKIILTAQHYLQHHKWTDGHNCRFDVIGINPSSPSKNPTPKEPYTLEWIKGAFSLS